MRLEKNLYEKIKLEAIKNNLNIKDFVSLSCLKNIDNSDLDFYLIDENNINSLLFQIKKIGVNINQIARKINSHELIEYNFIEFKERIDSIEKEINYFKKHLRKIK